MTTIKTFRKTLLCAVIVAFASLSAFAQDDLVMKIWQGAAIINIYPIASVDSVTFGSPPREVVHHQIISGLDTGTASACTVTNHNGYKELIATGDFPDIYTNALLEDIRLATYSKVTFNIEYQADRSIGNAELFYGRPNAEGGVSSGGTLYFENTGLDATDESKWRTFTFNCADAIATHSWGAIGHRMRWTPGIWNVGTTFYVKKVWFDIYVWE
jgi:hypothetical protein